MIVFAVVAIMALPRQAHAQGTHDGNFNVGTGANNRVLTSAMQLDGMMVVGGVFTNYGGTSRGRVARIKRDGSLDAMFNAAPGANNQVNTLAVTSDGKVYIGGAFTRYNGVVRNRIARLNADGSLDVSFAPGTGFNGGVNAIAVQTDGKVIVAGDFNIFNGTSRLRVARLNSNGTLDNTFNVGTGANFLVTSAAVQVDGKVLIGGYFNSYNGTTKVAIARLNSDGSMDTGFNTGGAGPNSAVAAITLQADGKILIGGFFTNYNGVSRKRIARLNANGTLDTGFNPGTGADNAVYAIAMQSNGAAILGGSFTNFGGVAHQRICRVSNKGVVDPSWTTSANNQVNTLCWIPEGKVIVGGSYTSVAGVSSNRIARLNALCTDNVTMSITTDANAGETAWELVPKGYQYAAYSGIGLPNNTTTTSSGCLADGNYQLRVTDAGGNGITSGGYVLTSQNGMRIIDNTCNFSTGSLSQLSGGQGGPTNISIPLSPQTPIYICRDKLDWLDGGAMVATENAAVTEVWHNYSEGSAQRANTGYDFWFYDPNGGYSFMKQRRHSNSDGFSPANATRACHMQVNHWGEADQIQANRLMNVRIRPVVLGVRGEWGPAYRFKIDPLRAQCPLTKLMDIPTNQFLSCGQTRNWGPGNYVHARPIAGANKYQFRFKLLDGTLVTTRTSNNYFIQLNWAATPLVPGTTYKVDVRCSFDGGTSWCTNYVLPAVDPWGDVCQLTINVNSAQGGEQRMLVEAPDSVDSELGQMEFWPNPGNGNVLNVRIQGLADDVQDLELLVLDANGRIVLRSDQMVAAPTWAGTLTFDHALPPGIYVINATAGVQHWAERWVVQE